jgi:hypothetical protein
MILRILALAAVVGLASPASAQQAVAPHGCTRPGENPGRLASDARRAAWIKSANGYLECLKKYISEQQAAYEKIVEKGKPHFEAANATIEEYNKAVVEFKGDQ